MYGNRVNVNKIKKQSTDASDYLQRLLCQHHYWERCTGSEHLGQPSMERYLNYPNGKGYTQLKIQLKIFLGTATIITRDTTLCGRYTCSCIRNSWWLIVENMFLNFLKMNSGLPYLTEIWNWNAGLQALVPRLPAIA